MIFYKGRVCSPRSGRRFVKQLAAVALVVAYAHVLQPRSAAQTPEAAEPGYTAEACPHGSNPNALLALEKKCSKDLTSDDNCRSYANFKKDSRAVEKYVIVKDCAQSKPYGYLLIPTETVVGVESSKIFSPSLVDVWGDAWLWSKKFPGRPSAMTGLAINSNLKGARSQNQFHIHISCASSEISKMLEAREISFDPAKALLLPLGVYGHRYYAVKVSSLTGANSPFNVAKAVLKPATDDLRGHGVAVLGSSNRDEYFVLISGSESGNPGNAEELLDQNCKTQN